MKPIEEMSFEELRQRIDVLKKQISVMDVARKNLFVELCTLSDRSNQLKPDENVGRFFYDNGLNRENSRYKIVSSCFDKDLNTIVYSYTKVSKNGLVPPVPHCAKISKNIFLTGVNLGFYRFENR